MDIFQAAILGVVEGITEFLPVSSTGHLMLAAQLLKLGQTDFVKSFEIAIQFGAILAVVVLYWKTIISRLDIWKKVLTAFLPTSVIGLLFYKILKKYLLSSSSIVLWALFLGGAALILFEIFYRGKDDSVATLEGISYPKALLIGLFQSIAIVPGVSRSAATIIGGLALGLNRKTIVEFSFLLAIPTMCAAMAFDLAKNIHVFTSANLLAFIVGFVVSFIVALLAVRFLLIFIKTHTFIPFGVYRILVAIAFWLGLR